MFGQTAADNPLLWKQPNVIISHISGNTADYNDKAADLFIENLERYLAGKALLNVVDLARILEPAQRSVPSA